MGASPPYPLPPGERPCLREVLLPGENAKGPPGVTGPQAPPHTFPGACSPPKWGAVMLPTFRACGLRCWSTVLWVFPDSVSVLHSFDLGTQAPFCTPAVGQQLEASLENSPPAYHTTWLSWGGGAKDKAMDRAGRRYRVPMPRKTPRLCTCQNYCPAAELEGAPSGLCAWCPRPP